MGCILHYLFYLFHYTFLMKYVKWSGFCTLFTFFLMILTNLCLCLQVSFQYQIVSEKFNTDSTVDIFKVKLLIAFLDTICILELPFDIFSVIEHTYLYWLTLDRFLINCNEVWYMVFCSEIYCHLCYILHLMPKDLFSTIRQNNEFFSCLI